MYFEERSYESKNLGQTMHYNVYGHAGKAVLVFPSSGGSHSEFGDFGMIEACRSWIERGLLRFYTPDSYDAQSWEASYKAPFEQALAHDAYDRFIIEELVPVIQVENKSQDKLLATGCSMGAYHAMNFGLRHPDVFATVISLSGFYDLSFLLGTINDEHVYLNSPTSYLANLADPWFLEQYRQNTFIVCTGQGPYEEPYETKKLEEVFQAKGVPGWFDYWGYDVAHDWNWWQKQLPYYLTELEAAGKV
ncbi:esterase family protein [Ligilactobacillus faecis]|uniref:Alpha/beta hydrolase-fold protein n=1 Tax=Ligilactobacillus faecis TaxID=762833 RepID=A0ABV4DPS9_9LACO|nr:alpha/beta hydrolase-fold protein [Ligilactobacillus faecis]WGN89323.1 alpha/beta hydrolase-fold protein [Ligilactobacillus faecis]